MKSFIRIGVDLAKNAFQVHGFEHEGGEPARRKLSRAKFREFFFRLGPSRVGMEACGSAHYWARELTAMGHDVVLMPPTYIKPYVKRGKNDALDAAAVCEAMSRRDMRFVPVKSADQQAVLMVHKTRELIVKQRTMSGNALRSHLAEFGLIAPKGVGRVAELLALAEADATLAEAAKAEVKLLAAHLEDLDLLDRQFAAERPSQRWIADFTHIWTAEGWLYVAAVIDLFSPRVVGWSMKAEMTAQRVADALVMAIWRRGKPDALLHHSDQGSQYASEQFQRLMADNRVTCSMSRSGNVWDNAAMESFFSSLKTERIGSKLYRSRDEARADVFDYIERFYNPVRRHSTIGHVRPFEFERKAALA